ncbi:hypothetical protein INT44_002197 [Umbelopsis vinacea]|uniref:Reverse transcriptase zinc-binding domain-containing protein n=1 Tax=Umbelopsis vinacea TaxID=44442 RepID=A0A8H7UGY8_9FUNG|nr:hypothetical protein INT44_002197 [Umbelopsis vinacea]
MNIPHAIRTPWWRTLQQKIPTKERLHNIFPGEHTITCRICQKENESDKHFWVGCERKWKFWVRMMNFKTIPSEIRSKDKVWSMIFLQRTRPQDEHILSEIGRVMLAIWITHWNSIKQEREWADQAAFNMYQTITQPTNDRFLPPKKKKTCNSWIPIVQTVTTRNTVEASVWRMCKCYQGQNKKGFPGGRPITDFQLVFPFQIIFDPKLTQREDITWLLAPWRDLNLLKLINLPHVAASL